METNWYTALKWKISVYVERVEGGRHCDNTAFYEYIYIKWCTKYNVADISAFYSVITFVWCLHPSEQTFSTQRSIPSHTHTHIIYLLIFVAKRQTTWKMCLVDTVVGKWENPSEKWKCLLWHFRKFLENWKFCFNKICIKKICFLFVFHLDNKHISFVLRQHNTTQHKQTNRPFVYG